MAVCPRNRGRGARRDGGAWTRRLSEDVWRDGATCDDADQGGAAVPGGAALCESARGGGGTAGGRPGGGDADLAGCRPPRGVLWIRPETPRTTDPGRPLAPPDS